MHSKRKCSVLVVHVHHLHLIPDIIFGSSKSRPSVDVQLPRAISSRVKKRSISFSARGPAADTAFSLLVTCACVYPLMTTCSPLGSPSTH